MHIKNIIMVLVVYLGVSLLPLSGSVNADEASSSKNTSKARLPITVSSYVDRPEENAMSVADGKLIYDRACVFCHGTKGDGKGPVAYFLSRDTAPHPRDLTSGIFKFRSTESGELPTDEDLFRILTRGIVGFMPSFVGLDVVDRWKVVYYVKSLNPDFKGSDPQPINIVGNPIPLTSGSVHKGYEVYQSFKCGECHGAGGQGNGEKAVDLKDDWGFLLPPRNLVMKGSFKNGSRPEDIYLTIMTGLDGGAMPSYADFFEGEEENVWHLANYILSLSK